MKRGVYDSTSLQLKRLADTESTNLYLSNVRPPLLLPPPHPFTRKLTTAQQIPRTWTEPILLSHLAPSPIKSIRLLRTTDEEARLLGICSIGSSRGIGFARFVFPFLFLSFPSSFLPSLLPE